MLSFTLVMSLIVGIAPPVVDIVKGYTTIEACKDAGRGWLNGVPKKLEPTQTYRASFECQPVFTQEV